MHRFFITAAAVTPDETGVPAAIHIDGEEAWHLARVLRLRPGDTIVAGDGAGRDYEAVLTEVGERAAVARVTAVRRNRAETRVPILLLQGLPKAEKMDWIVQKCTELGVAGIYPVATERAVVKIPAEKAAARIDRWERIAREAAKQAGRASWPPVVPVASLPNALALARPSHLLVPWEEAQRPLVAAMAEIAASPALARLGVAIGPEGGFAASEVEMMAAAGGIPVSLGPRILRTETAGLATIAAILYALGELGG